MPPRSPADPALAAALRSLREARGVGQETVAYKAGLSVATYARLERGQVNPTWTTIRSALAALDVSLREFSDELERHERGSS